MAAIVVYYSRAGENYFGGTMKVIEKGNTEIAAERIAAQTGAALFKAEQTTPYSDEYRACIAQAKADFDSGARPALQAMPEGMAQYDTIYLGYPIYCGTMPMALFTLLEGIDTAGKTIRPFCTHEGSGMARSADDIRKLCPGASVGKSLAILGREVENARPAIDAWCAEQ